eukprot:m.43725 g.43725  ORF g.43725 m.43725 type:complete len:263 (-) comp19466_c0_seq2:253-1041(-)
MANSLLWGIVAIATLSYTAHLISRFLERRRRTKFIAEQQAKVVGGKFKSKGKEEIYAANQNKLLRESAQQQELRQRKRTEELEAKARQHGLNGNRFDPETIRTHRQVSTTKTTREMVAESRLIREIQEEEYRRSLEADQLKEANEVDRRQKQAEKEMESKRAEIETVARMEVLRTRLGVEPAATTAETCEIIVRFPDGSKNQRRFLVARKVQDIMDVSELEGFPPSKFSLFTSYPRMCLDDSSQTFHDLKFRGRVTLHCTEK